MTNYEDREGASVVRGKAVGHNLFNAGKKLLLESGERL